MSHGTVQLEQVDHGVQVALLGDVGAGRDEALETRHSGAFLTGELILVFYNEDS